MAKSTLLKQLAQWSKTNTPPPQCNISPPNATLFSPQQAAALRQVLMRPTTLVMPRDHTRMPPP